MAHCPCHLYEHELANGAVSELAHQSIDVRYCSPVIPSSHSYSLSHYQLKTSRGPSLDVLLRRDMDGPRYSPIFCLRTRSIHFRTAVTAVGSMLEVAAAPGAVLDGLPRP